MSYSFLRDSKKEDMKMGFDYLPSNYDKLSLEDQINCYDKLVLKLDSLDSFENIICDLKIESNDDSISLEAFLYNLI